MRWHARIECGSREAALVELYGHHVGDEPPRGQGELVKRNHLPLSSNPRGAVGLLEVVNEHRARTAQAEVEL